MAAVNVNYHVEKPGDAQATVSHPEADLRGSVSRFATVDIGALSEPHVTFILHTRETGEAFALALTEAGKKLTEFYFPEEPGA